MASATPTDDRVVNTPLGSVEIRPIRDREMRLLGRLATRRDGNVDMAKLDRLVFQRGTVDPSFTPSEVEQIFLRFGPAVQLCLDAIYAISTGVEVPRVRHRHAHRDVAVLNALSRRRGHRSPVVRHRGRARRRGCNTRLRGSRRSGSRAGPDDGDGSSDEDLAPVAGSSRPYRPARQAGATSGQSRVIRKEARFDDRCHKVP